MTTFHEYQFFSLEPARWEKRPSRASPPTSVCVCVGGGGGGGGLEGGEGVTKKNWAGCAAGTFNTPPIHIIPRLTKHTYSYNLHVKR